MRRRLLSLLLSVFLSTFAFSQQFTSSWSVAESGPVGNITTGDYNRDGKPDFSIMKQTGSGANAIAIYQNDGSSQFHKTVELPIGGQNYRHVAVDINNDGNLDIVVPLSGTQSIIQTFLGDGKGGFTPGPTTPETSAFASDVVAGDFNGDNRADIATIECESASGNCNIEIYLGNGTGAFTHYQTVLAGGHVYSLVATDFNKDGKVDVAAEVDQYTEVWFGAGTGSFGSPYVIQVPDTVTPNSIAVGDFNGDAVPDLAIEVPHVCGSACGNNKVWIYKSNGDGTFTQGAKFDIGPAAAGYLRVGDINGDLKQDIISWSGAHYGGGAEYALGNGDGTFAAPVRMGVGDESADFILRDMDLDGRLDIITDEYIAWGVVVFRGTSAAVNCPTASSSDKNAFICQPDINTTTTTSPVTIKASGNSPAGIQRLELWVDGFKVSQILNDQLKTTVAMSPGTHTITIVVVDKNLGYAKTSRSLTITSEAACPYNGGLNVCAPSEGGTYASPVRVSASAQSNVNITGMRVYVDNVSAFNTSASQFTTDIAMSAGAHTLVIKSWDATGRTMSTTRHITVTSGSGGTCSTPTTSPSVNVCTPTEGSTVNSNVHVTAKARWDGKMLTGARIYVDNVSVWSSGMATSSIDTTITLNPGTHTMVVKFWENGGTSISATRHFTVQ